MAKANRIRTRYPGISKVGERYEWVAGRDRGRGTTDTLEEARSAKAKAELAGPVSAAVRGRFGDYAWTWIAGYQGRTNRGFSESTRADCRKSLDLYLIPFFEARTLKPHQITRQHVKALIAWLATEPTAAERREKMGCGGRSRRARLSSTWRRSRRCSPTRSRTTSSRRTRRPCGSTSRATRRARPSRSGRSPTSSCGRARRGGRQGPAPVRHRRTRLAPAGASSASSAAATLPRQLTGRCCASSAPTRTRHATPTASASAS